TGTPISDGPLLGDAREGPSVLGTSYHAISANGETAFFSATPTAKQLPTGEKQTVYARVPCVSGSRCAYVEADTNGLVEREGPNSEKDVKPEGRETIPVSNPPDKECEPEGNSEKCAPQPATFQGASADGSKVFFTTEQELLPNDKDIANGQGGGNDL